MPTADSGAPALASLPDGSTAGELFPELARHGLQHLIELEVAAVLGHEVGVNTRLLRIPKIDSDYFDEEPG
jgi:hypothetical protein